MAANKVIFGNNTLIDLTSDTITAEDLKVGVTAHKKDGTIITGTAFSGYPSTYMLVDALCDSSGNYILDSSGNGISGRMKYVRE